MTTANAPSSAGGARNGGELVIEHVSHSYGHGPTAISVLDDVSFTVPTDSVTCVVGPSGCGKSTLLSLAAGLMSPTSGRLRWDGAEVRLGPSKHLGMAFQQPGLFPWMTVHRNVAVGLETRGASKRDARRIADEFLATVGLADFARAYPSQLSGGMAQRVGIARALALQPRLLLLDEPFAAVDAFTRLTLQGELISMLDLVKPTVVLVTHDVSEAITLGHVIVVMSNRPAGVKAVIPVAEEDRDKSTAAYAHRLAQVLGELGVTGQHGPPVAGRPE